MEEEMGEEFDLAVPLPPSLLLLSLLPLPLSPRLPFLHSFSLLSLSPFSSISCSPFIILTHPSSYPLLSTKCLPLHRHYLHHLLSFPSSNQFLLSPSSQAIFSSSCNLIFYHHYSSSSSFSLAISSFISIITLSRLFFPLLQSLLSSSLLGYSFPSCNLFYLHHSSLLSPPCNLFFSPPCSCLSPSCPTTCHPKLPPCQEEASPSAGVPRSALDPPLLHRVPRANVDDVVAPEAQNPEQRIIGLGSLR